MGEQQETLESFAESPVLLDEAHYTFGCDLKKIMCNIYIYMYVCISTVDFITRETACAAFRSDKIV